jgi:hypothetical protein
MATKTKAAATAHLLVDTDRIAGWIFIQTTDAGTYTFGPFEDYEDLRMWLATIAVESNIDGNAVPLINPASEPVKFWEPLYKIVE